MRLIRTIAALALLAAPAIAGAPMSGRRPRGVVTPRPVSLTGAYRTSGSIGNTVPPFSGNMGTADIQIRETFPRTVVVYLFLDPGQDCGALLTFKGEVLVTVEHPDGSVYSATYWPGYVGLGTLGYVWSSGPIPAPVGSIVKADAWGWGIGSKASVFAVPDVYDWLWIAF